jgi:hypothetical protein
MLRFHRSNGTFPILFCLLAALFGGATVTSAQQPAETYSTAAPEGYAQAPAHVAFVDGVVVLERDGQIDNEPGNMPLLAGDRLRTRGGRVEVLFADGSTLHLDHNSAVDFQSDELIRLVEGRIRLTIPGPDREVAYRIDGPQGWAQIREPGEYRVALLNAPGGPELELAVIRGAAELANNDGQTALRAGERAFARLGAAPSYAYVANSAALDAFDRWSDLRREDRLSAHAEYLPDEVRPYAASFEAHGYWRDEPTYGRVWYPRVASDWRPYYRGRWVNLRPYGWTWVAHDPWGWPTHHYGRWGVSAAGSWFWIPGRSWGAAWVSWAYAPGYVSWCPLGWNNRPIFSININVGRRHYDPWRAWTVVPHQRFGYGYVHRNYVRPGLIDVRVRGAFAHGDRPPQIRGYAVPRSGAPIRVAGTGARPRLGDRSPAPSRAGTPLYTNVPEDRGRIRGDGARITVPSAQAPRGARPNPSASQRAVPTRPAVRVDRPADTQVDRRSQPSPQARPIDGARPSDTRRAPGATIGRDTETRQSPAVSADRDTGARRAVPRTAAPRSEPSPRPTDIPRRVETPRAGDTRQPSAPSRIQRTPQPPPRGGDRAPAAVPRSGAPGPQRPDSVRRVETPRAGSRRTEGARPSPSAPPSGASRSAQPSRPTQTSRPTQASRPPQGGGGGGTEARRPADAARPPAASSPRGGEARPSPSGARPSQPSPQARPKAVPRPGGGGGGVK